MSAKNLINAGIGFSPGSPMFIITRGLTPGAAAVSVPVGFIEVFVTDALVVQTPTEQIDVSVGTEGITVKEK